MLAPTILSSTPQRPMRVQFLPKMTLSSEVIRQKRAAMSKWYAIMAVVNVAWLTYAVYRANVESEAFAGVFLAVCIIGAVILRIRASA